ncbi:hypothetical protein EVAR_63793_1 [Eumeta japonica]|uniref:Uncharacterized protein n=1 Tax=Eumeta variegata TaxID=151549 RepID=A0A4C1ZNB6_EUMVA|nr:hypothetical protein EVAR_63793_1 [Eumeta japonica]
MRWTFDDDAFEGSGGGGGEKRQPTEASTPASAAVETTNTTEGAQVIAAMAVEEAELLSTVAEEQESWASLYSGISFSSYSEYVLEENSTDISSPAVTPLSGYLTTLRSRRPLSR